MIPGEILPSNEPVELPAPGSPARITVTNTGNVPVHLTAHYHLAEANKLLSFDRRKAFGMRLYTHAKGAVRIKPGETQEIDIVSIGGARRIYGFNNAVNGSLDSVDAGDIVQQLVARGFLHQPEESE